MSDDIVYLKPNRESKVLHQCSKNTFGALPYVPLGVKKDFTDKDINFLHQKVASEALVYMGHYANGLMMTDGEIGHMNWLRELSAKLKGEDMPEPLPNKNATKEP